MTGEQIMQVLYASLGQLVIFGGGSVAIAFGVFRFLGQRWIEHKFSEQLENHKHKQAKEIENIKFKINSMFNRIAKMQEKEFEVLPIAWAKLKDAHGPLMVCVLGFQEYACLNQMSADELEEFLGSIDLLETQKQQLRNCEDKEKLFSNFLTVIQINKARAAFSEFQSYIEKNRIFLSKEIGDKFMKASELMWSFWVAKNVGERSGNIDMALDKYAQHNNDLQKLIQEIEGLIHPCLFPQGYTSSSVD